MAKLLKMLWEYMDLTVLPFFETWSAHIFGGWQRVCWCTKEAFNQASPTKEYWENCPQKKGGHIYGKNEGWAYLRKLLYLSIITIVIIITTILTSSCMITSILSRRSGAGDYMCTASNGVGPLQHATITLSVLCKFILKTLPPSWYPNISFGAPLL